MDLILKSDSTEGTTTEDTAKAMQWVLLYVSISNNVTENTSHRTAKMCWSSVMHIHIHALTPSIFQQLWQIM
jgi:hypothetical protein